MTPEERAAEELYAMFHPSRRNDGYEEAKHREWMEKVTPVISEAVRVSIFEFAEEMERTSVEVGQLISQKITDDVREGFKQARAEVRAAVIEECAKLAEDWGWSSKPEDALAIAAAIRALAPSGGERKEG